MIKRIVGCWVGRLSVKEEGVVGEYWLGERKGEEREEVRLMGCRVVFWVERRE